MFLLCAPASIDNELKFNYKEVWFHFAWTLFTICNKSALYTNKEASLL